MKKRLVIADSKTSLREMLRQVLTSDGLYEIVGEAASGLAAVDLCRKLQPHLVVLDSVLPELSAAEVVRRLRRVTPGTRALIYSDCACALMVAETLRAKPHGYVERSESLATLHEAIAAVAAGSSYFSPFPAKMLYATEAADGELLTPREREIAQMTAEGGSSKDIADRLALAPKTVENHRMHIMQKLHIHCVADLTRYAVARGWVTAA
jgi:DNA-binding NarL/FixJ family response regulator